MRPDFKNIIAVTIMLHPTLPQRLSESNRLLSSDMLVALPIELNLRILLPGIDPGTPTYKIDMITISNIGVCLYPPYLAPTQARTGVDGS